MKKILNAIIILFMFCFIGCDGGGGGGGASASNNSISGLGYLGADLLHMPEGMLSDTLSGLRSTGFEFVVVLDDEIAPRSYAPSFPVRRNVSYPTVYCGISSWTYENLGGGFLAQYGGYTEAALTSAVEKIISRYNGNPILLTWEQKTNHEWTLELARRLRQAGVGVPFYHNNLLGGNSLNWGSVGSIPATSCGGGGGPGVDNYDGCDSSDPVNDIVNFNLNGINRQTWYWCASCVRGNMASITAQARSILDENSSANPE